MKHTHNIAMPVDGLTKLIETCHYLDAHPDVLVDVQRSLPSKEWTRITFETIRWAARRYDHLLALDQSELYGLQKPTPAQLQAAAREYYRWTQVPIFGEAINGLRLAHIRRAEQFFCA